MNTKNAAICLLLISVYTGVVFATACTIDSYTGLNILTGISTLGGVIVGFSVLVKWPLFDSKSNQ